MNITSHVSEAVRGGCAAIGNFDGVHRGHREMLQTLVAMARNLSTHSVVVTFHPHPMSLLRPEYAPPLLTSIPDRIRLLRQAGVDHVVVLPVDAELFSMTTEEFFESFVLYQLEARGLVEGVNFRFGRDRLGGAQELRGLCKAAGIRLELTELVAEHAEEVSSSRIRSLIKNGRLSAACELLGHAYSLRGTVQHGAGRGASLGFPTANLTGIQTLMPAHGVYAGIVRIGKNRHEAAVNIGPNPTFGDWNDKVECYIDQFSGSLYGQELVVQLLSEIRGLLTFPDVDALSRQIERDVAVCRQVGMERANLLIPE